MILDWSKTDDNVHRARLRFIEFFITQPHNDGCWVATVEVTYKSRTISMWSSKQKFSDLSLAKDDAVQLCVDVLQSYKVDIDNVLKELLAEIV